MRLRRAFTLVELMVVMVIIGILMTFILKAYSGSVRRAEEKATIALVAKLEQAMTDRVDALTTYQADPTPAHYALAALYNGTNPRIESVQRAQVIAQFDYLRAQLPDVFMKSGLTTYPFNFAGQPMGGLADANYQLPIGNAVLIANGGSWDGNAATLTPGTGIHGAAYEIASGIYKQLGYGPKGIDGNDNNGNGLVDERAEGNLDLSPSEISLIDTRIANHTHKTARAEMLYAILVEGGGTYGSSFDKDDFTSREVQDTDGDGLMEFVDAWGEPLQFYRWPILYRSDSQKGFPDVAKLTLDKSLGLTTPGPYNAAKSGAFFISYEQREQNPLDPNQTLLAPAWWGRGFNNSVPTGIGTPSGNVSGAAMTFMTHFIPLLDPIAADGSPSAAAWDRSTANTSSYYMRRAYYSRFLILSGGPDKMPGTARLTDPKDREPIVYATLDDRATIETPTGTVTGPGTLMTGNARDKSGAAVGINVSTLLIESQGGRVDLNRGNLQTLSILGADGRNDTNSQLEYYSQDDISSQNLQGTGGVLQ